MPPIRPIDDAFLSQLLQEDADVKDIALNSNIDSDSLSLVLKKLESTSNALQQEIFNKVSNNFDDFSSLYNDSQSIHWKVLELVESVSKKEKEVHSDGTNVHSTIETYKQAVFESEKNQSKINTLEKIEETLQKLNAINGLLKHSDYLQVVQDLIQLTESLESWSDGDDRIVSLLSQQISLTKQSLITQLQDDISTAIQFNLGSVRILETFQPSPDSQTSVHIRNVLKCLYQLNILPEQLMRVNRLIFKNIFHPYFENISSTLQMDEVQAGPLSKGGVLQIIKRPNDTDDGPHSMDPVEMIQQVDSMIGFFYKYIFSNEDDKEIKQLFGNLLSPELFELMINKSIVQAIPSSKDHLADFDRVTETVATFENRCRDMYGFQLDNEELNTLGGYVSNIDKHYAKKRCEKILQQGRKVMIRRLYDTDTAHVTGEDDHTYRFQITQTPQILLVLISDTLSEAADLLDSHPISASTLIKGVQDLLDMYRAIMPSFHRSQYLSSAANSLIFRNDCMWLANQLSTDISKKPQVKQFKNCNRDLQEASKRLEELGKAWHELSMTQCLQMIQRVLEPLDGFSGMSENAKFQQDCDHAITRVIEIVKSFASNTRPVVDGTLFLDMLGRIVDKILTGFITDIENLVDIGAEESHIIARNLNSLAQLVGVFDLPGKDATEGFVIDLVPNWEKFWLVKDILEMNMREIMEFYRHGKLHMFEKSELVGLLCSLFADTDLREANINEIKSGRIAQDRHISTTPTAAFTTTPTATATPPTATASIFNTGLEYQPDEDTEMGDGWGDNEDDDLFGEPEPAASHAPSSTTTHNTVNHGLDYQPDEDMGELGDGWGDNDDDLFGEDQVSANTTSKSVEPTTSPVNHDLEYTPEEDMDEMGDGWGDDNDDLFLNSDPVPEPTVNTTIPSPKPAPVTSPTNHGLEYTPEGDLEEEIGQGWGDDDDDDLFGEHK